MSEQLLLHTLRTLAEVSNQSRVAIQAIFQWSSAGIAAAFGGGLVLVSSSSFSNPQSWSLSQQVVLIVIFDLAIPAVSLLSGLALLAEVHVGIRARQVHRSYEYELVREARISSGEASHPALLVFLALQLDVAGRRGYFAITGYISQLAFYCGTALLSSLVCATLVGESPAAHSSSWVSVLAGNAFGVRTVDALVALVGVLVAGTLLLMSRRIYRLRGAFPLLGGLERAAVAAADMHTDRSPESRITP